MKKGFGTLIVSTVCAAIMVLPVSASTTRLDVREGDRNSYYTYKDAGQYEYENYFYVTPETYIGSALMGISVSQQGSYSSGWKSIYNKALKYQYDVKAPGGIYYRLETGPHAATPANWHLTGWYTP